MSTWQTQSLRWISLGGNVWVRVDQIEGVWLDSRRRVIVKAISGQEYVADESVALKTVLNRMAKARDDD